MYDVNYFIDKFEKIPEEEWNIGAYKNIDGNKHCAYGHCGVRGLDDSFANFPEAKALSQISVDEWAFDRFADINDGLDWNYKQPTPKQRILAALRDIKNMQPRKDITASLAQDAVQERLDVVKVKEVERV